MRRLTTTDRDDRGGATVFIIVAITAVMIGAGFAIDVGQYVVTARSAQNTADATALAVATDCALTGAPIADYSPYRKPGQTINAPACGSGEATITATKDVDGLFLQQSAGAVDRTATARWGTIATANVLPIVISDCEFSRGAARRLERHHPLPRRPQAAERLFVAPRRVQPARRRRVRRDDLGRRHRPRPTGSAHSSKVVPCITNPNSPALPHDVFIPIYNAAPARPPAARARVRTRSSASRRST